MEIIITLILFAICIGFIYLLVRWFLAEDFFVNKISNKHVKEIVKAVVLFIFTGLIGGTILYLYSSFGIENKIYQNLAILASMIFVLWLGRVEYYINNKNNSGDVYTDKSSKLLIFSAAGLIVIPLILNVFFN